ncbi:nitroreductase family protein [Pseudomonas sp. NPDC012596]|uniref:nitroreductase family protein n=1 Tax=Pseudomonas sp. NPDC012596 TaxID=3364419 RepID=UPI003696C6A4
MTADDFQRLVRTRRVARQFLPTPVNRALLDALLMDAQHSPSNCNTQPWVVHVVSGATRDVLSKALRAADARGDLTPDFEFDMQSYTGVHAQRAQSSGRARYEAINVARDDRPGRLAAMQHNLSFFDAPHVALLFMPRIHDYVRSASDVGMYAQTFLLSLHARGLAGIPQTLLGLYAQTIREVLGIEEEMKLMFGISFGYADPQSPANFVAVGRAPLCESVTQHV